jgi:hypothetical protein
MLDARRAGIQQAAIKDNMGWSGWKKSGNLTTYERKNKQ